jgi:hypothetical protein
MEVYSVEILLHIFLTSGLEGDEWLASRPHLLIPGDRALHTRYFGRWKNLPTKII